MEGLALRGGRRSQWDSLEKALSRRPGLLGTGAAGTAVPVAGAVSGSTTLRASQGASEPRPGLNPLLPPAHSQVAPGVIIFVIVLIVILTGWLCGNDTGVSRARSGSGPPPPAKAPGSLTHPRFRSLPHCWLQRERTRGRLSQLRWGLSCAQPQALGPAPHLPPSESCREDGTRWEPPGGCGDLLGVKSQRSCLGWSSGATGVAKEKGSQPKELRGRERGLEEKGPLTGWGAGLAGSGVDRT